MSKLTQIKRYIVAGSLVGALALTSVAFAQPGDGNGNGPGRSGNDRGQRFQQLELAERPYLGVRIEATEGDVGVRVVEVAEGTPAEAAGVLVDDVIVAFNDVEVTTTQSLVEAVAASEIDSTVNLTVTRGEEDITLEITVGSVESLSLDGQIMPFNFGFGGRGPRDGMQFGQMQMLGGHGRLGVAFVTLDEATAEENGVSLTEGALISEVAEESPAAEAGLAVGDVVTAVNGEPVDAERTLRDRLIAYEPGDTISLTVVRGEETLTLDVTLAEPDFPMFDLGQMFRFGDGNGLGNGGFRFELPIPVIPDGSTQPGDVIDEIIEPVGSV